MKRPLAVFGASFLLCMLAAARLPVAALFAATALLAAAFAVCLALLHKWRGGVAPLLAAAACAALLCMAVFNAAVLAPLQRLAGSERMVTARVVDVQQAAAGDAAHATLELLAVEGADASPFKARLYWLPELAVGDEVAFTARFYEFGSSASRMQNYGKGYYVGVSAVSEIRVLGQNHSFVTRMRLWQHDAAGNIRAHLPQRLSSVMAAMAVGDKSTLSAGTKSEYQAAGLSHVLVVSGLHLSILCGGVNRLLNRLLRHRRLAAGCSMAFVVLFGVFTGLTASVVRSGVVWLLVFVAQICFRRADVYTSLGVAALVLAVQNPYAAGDVGLLLSFAAALGALGSGRLQSLLRVRWRGRDEASGGAVPGVAVRVLRRLGLGVLTPLLTTFATLPVLIYAGMGVSLLSIPVNVLAVPFVMPIVLCGLLLAVPAWVPVLGWLGGTAAIVGGGLLVLFEKITQWCAALPGAVVPLGGAFGLVVCAAVYVLLFCGFRRRQVLAFSLAALLLLPAALLLHTGLSAGTVKLVVAGSGQNASLVVIKGEEAAVLYRSRLSAPAVEDVFWQNRVKRCVLFVDMRKTAESTEYYELFNPQRVVLAGQEVPVSAAFAPFDGVSITLARQGSGLVACADVAGYKLGLYTGSVNLAPYAPLDVLVAGSGEVQGEFALLLAPGSVPGWVGEEVPVAQSDGNAMLWLRPGRGLRMREAIPLDG